MSRISLISLIALVLLAPLFLTAEEPKLRCQWNDFPVGSIRYFNYASTWGKGEPKWEERRTVLKEIRTIGSCVTETQKKSGDEWQRVQGDLCIGKTPAAMNLTLEKTEPAKIQIGTSTVACNKVTYVGKGGKIGLELTIWQSPDAKFFERTLNQWQSSALIRIPANAVKARITRIDGDTRLTFESLVTSTNETITVGDQSLTCLQEKISSVYEKTGFPARTETSTRWLSPKVPGLMVKFQTNDRNPSTQEITTGFTLGTPE